MRQAHVAGQFFQFIAAEPGEEGHVLEIAQNIRPVQSLTKSRLEFTEPVEGVGIEAEKMDFGHGLGSRSPGHSVEQIAASEEMPGSEVLGPDLTTRPAAGHAFQYLTRIDDEKGVSLLFLSIDDLAGRIFDDSSQIGHVKQLLLSEDAEQRRRQQAVNHLDAP